MKIKMLILFASLASTLFAVETPAKHAITHEDVWLMKRLDTPVPSPDGQWVVFGVTDPAYEAKESSSDLWLKSLTDDAPARRITFSKPGESGVAWSPDSRRFAFASKRATQQLHIGISKLQFHQFF